MLLQEGWWSAEGVGGMIRRGKLHQGLTGTAAVRINGRKLPVGWRRWQVRPGKGLLGEAKNAVVR